MNNLNLGTSISVLVAAFGTAAVNKLEHVKSQYLPDTLTLEIGPLFLANANGDAQIGITATMRRKNPNSEDKDFYEVTILSDETFHFKENLTASKGNSGSAKMEKRTFEEKFVSMASLFS